MEDCSTIQRKGINQIRVSNRYIGEVEDGKFKKRIQFSKHALHTPPALALSVETIVQAEQFGAHEIEITDLESGRVYSCSLEHFNRYSWKIQRGGFEPQRALALERWSVSLPIVNPDGGTIVFAKKSKRNIERAGSEKKRRCAIEFVCSRLCLKLKLSADSNANHS